MATAVCTDRLTKDFTTGFWRPRPHRGLDGLTFEIPVGGVVGLLGPNGAGKTTTVKVALGLMKPTAGTVHLGVEGLGRVGYLPENPYFYDYLTADELLTYFAGLFGYSPADCRARASRLLDRVGLGADRQRPLRQYSKGMVQRVGIAQALVNDPELVLLDEPMTGLDPVGRVEVKRIIERLHERGKTVMFNSHILSDVHELCSRIAIMRDGRVIWTGSVDEALAEAETLEDFFMRVVQA